MLTSIIAIAIVLIGIVAYLWVFNKLRKKNLGDLLEEAVEGAVPAGLSYEVKEGDEDKPTEIFKAVDEVTNTQSSLGHDADTSSVTATMSFEEKIGKDTVVVEIPGKKANRAEPKLKAIAAKAQVVRKTSEKKPDTTEELIVKLKQRIARRIDLLKLAGLPEDDDKTLAKYRYDLKKLTYTVRKEKAAAKAAKEAPAKAESAEKPATAEKPAKKATKKPIKKSTKKSTKKTTKKATGKTKK